MSDSYVQLIGGGNRMARYGPIELPEPELKLLEQRRTRKARKSARKKSGVGETALMRAGKIFEEIVLEWFRWQDLFPDSRRELYYRDIFGVNQGAAAETREIDGFFPDIDLLMEARVSVQGIRALGKEIRQVLTSLEVMRYLRPEAQPCIVFVKVGPEPIESYPEDILCGDIRNGGARLNIDAIRRTWSEGARTPEGHPNVPRIVFDLGDLQGWLRRHREWYVHPSIHRESLDFAEARWLRRQQALERRRYL